MIGSYFETMNAWVSAQLGATSGPAGFLLLFLGGAAASLLPCVYPLYPVTVSVLRARSGDARRHAHPIAYYAGLASMYVGFGVLASLTGGAFNEVVRLPSAHLAIGALLLVLGLATAGFVHFPVLSTRVGEASSGLSGTFAMGLGAGLLSSACVGPVVVSILVGIASGASGVTLGSAAHAASKMGVFGLGVGLPVVLVGVLGVSLPKGGRWMVHVQRTFGALIAAFALGYVRKGLFGYGIDDALADGILAGAVLCGVSAFLLQDAERPVDERTRRSLLLVAGTVGFLLMARNVVATAGAAAGPAAPSGTAALATTETHGNLTWFLDRDLAFDEAARTGRPVFIDFFGSWCTNCRAFEERTQDDPELNRALLRAVLLKVYDTSPIFEDFERDPRFPELRVGLPFFLVTDAEGNVVYKTNDFTRTDEMILFLSS